jgi:hypothetical protein
MTTSTSDKQIALRAAASGDRSHSWKVNFRFLREGKRNRNEGAAAKVADSCRSNMGSGKKESRNERGDYTGWSKMAKINLAGVFIPRTDWYFRNHSQVKTCRRSWV